MNESWEATSIGEIFDVGAGKSVTPAARLGERRHPFLRTSNIFWGRVDVTELSAMHFSDEEIEAKALKKGDLLVCEGGDIGRAAIWNGEVEKCGFQNHLHRLRPKAKEVVPRFYMYYLQAGFTQLGIYEGAGNKTTIPNLSRSRLEALRVPEPKEVEHKKIAAVLWKVQRAIEVEEKLVATAQELKQLALRQLFTRGLTADLVSDDGFPESWRPAQFIDLAELHRGYDLPVAQRRTGTIPVIGSNGIVGFHNEGKSTGPGVITGRSGTIGRSFYIDDAYWPLNTGLFVSDFKGNRPLFVHYFFEHFNFDQYSAGVSVPTLNRNLIHEVPIRIPDDDVQGEIAAVLQTVDRKISVHERKRAALQELFKTLLNQLMTGRISVAELDIDTSEVTGC